MLMYRYLASLSTRTVRVPTSRYFRKFSIWIVITDQRVPVLNLVGQHSGQLCLDGFQVLFKFKLLTAVEPTEQLFSSYRYYI
eukprot:SAG31_NODE_2792_length_5084_cov_2.581745_3_plen_82_part_00